MAHIKAERIAEAALALRVAGRWDQAAVLLASTTDEDASERALLAVAAADVATDRDFWLTQTRCDAALDYAATAVDAVGEPNLRYDLDFIILKRDCATASFARFEPGYTGPAPVPTPELERRAAGLREAAPDPGRLAWATFYAGVIAQLLADDQDAARPLYAEALRLGEQAGDALIAPEALRHLGALAYEAQDPGPAGEHWHQSMRLWQQAGSVPHVLAQLLALADLARDTGDPAWARTVAAEVRDWARALGDGTWLEAAASSHITSR